MVSAIKEPARFLTLSRSSGIAIFAVLSLAGCESLRLHDPGRLKVAEETATEAATLTAAGGAVFAPMEANLDEVSKIQVDLQSLSRRHEFETYQEVLARQTPEGIGEKLLEVMETRRSNFLILQAQEAAAAAAVNEALDRQSLVSTVIKNETPKELARTQDEFDAAVAAGEQAKAARLKRRLATLGDLVAAETSSGADSLDRALARTKGWLDWIDNGLARFDEAQNALDGLSGGGVISDSLVSDLGGLGDDASANAKVVGSLVKEAQVALDQVEQDPNLQAAQQLLRATIQQTAATEQARLVEYRRSLNEIKRLGERLRVRDQVAVCTLYISALGALFPAITDPALRQGLVDVTADLSRSGRYKNAIGPSCLPDLSSIQPNSARRDRWGNPPRLDEYVASALVAAKADPGNRGLAGQARLASQLVGAVGILVFYERYLVDDTILEMASEQHLHSIRLSRINAGQRADIVNQLAQGLQIYYQGGVKPEEIAQLFLLAAQVGGIFFIGSQL